MKLILEKPPSVNHLYGYTARGGFARSYITKEGILWFEEMAAVIGKSFKRKTITDPVEVWVELYHIRKKTDTDNILKALFDLLSKRCVECQTKIINKKGCVCGKNHSVLLDDDLIYKHTVEKFKINTGEKEHVIVEIMGYS